MARKAKTVKYRFPDRVSQDLLRAFLDKKIEPTIKTLKQLIYPELDALIIDARKVLQMDSYVSVLTKLIDKASSKVDMQKSIKKDVENASKSITQAYDKTLKQSIGSIGLSGSITAAIENFNTSNVSLISNLSDETVHKTQQFLLQKFSTGARASEIQEGLEEQFGIARRKAALIAIDQVGKLQGNVAQIRQTSLGIEEYIWRTAGDDRVREEHAALDGTRQRWDDPPPDGHPGQAVRCRCIAEPIFADNNE